MTGWGKIKAALVGGAMSLVAVPVSAAVLTFNFNGNGGDQPGASMVFTSGGQSVTVTAGALALNKEFNMVSRIGQWSEGLGNKTNYSYCTDGATTCSGYKKKDVTDASHEVDDWIEVDNYGTSKDHGVREFLKLDFGALNVSILNIDFGYHQNGDGAVVKINNNSTQIYAGNADPITTGFAAYSPTNLFWILAGNDNNNDWKLKSITVSYDDTPGPGPEEVPVPAALSLMGLGLAGLGLARRRRNA